MYLLIPGSTGNCYTLTSFTFLHVSINSFNSTAFYFCIYAFTFQHVSINSHEKLNFDFVIHEFTFQHVSINSGIENLDTLNSFYLHSNMYLLIQGPFAMNEVDGYNLHPNMYLLIPFSLFTLFV